MNLHPLALAIDAEARRQDWPCTGKHGHCQCITACCACGLARSEVIDRPRAESERMNWEMFKTRLGV